MKDYSLFDIIGPIMIGPSSSHTAGAAKISYMARKIVGKEIKEVIFYLHGSFAKTHKGHGTDKALLAGIMGYKPDDERLKDSINIAKKNKINFYFVEADLGDVHPNSVKINIKTIDNEEWEVSGSSLGGGKAKIYSINNMEVDFNGEYTTLITNHHDTPGVTAGVTYLLASYNINIAFMKLFREAKNKNAMIIIETDQEIPDDLINEILQNKNIKMVKVLKPI